MENKTFPDMAADMMALNSAVTEAVEVACATSIDKWGHVVATSAKAEVAVTKAFQRVLDIALKVGVPTTAPACKALASLILEHEGFKGKVDAEDARQAREWARVRRLWGACLIRAHHFKVPFSLDLAGDKDKALPWEETKKKPKETKSIADLIRDGAPTVGKAADLAVLLSYTIKSCRAAGLPGLAAELLDCVKDAIPTFEE